MKRLVHLLLLATFAGSVDLKLWKTDETFGFFILNRKGGGVRIEFKIKLTALNVSAKKVKLPC